MALREDKANTYPPWMCCVQLPFETRFVANWGGKNTYMIPYHNCEKNYLNILGRIEVGGLTKIGGGALIAVGDGAVVKFGKECSMNNRVKLFCENRIEFEDYVRLSWECQVFDSNFHYTSHNGEIKPKSGPVHIQKYTWIGNRVTIQKNVKLPAYSVVASNSVVNKDYSSNEEGGLYAGLPAKLLSTGNRRIIGADKELFIDMLFEEGRQVVTEADLEKEREILIKRFFDGRTQMEVANEIGISQAQVSRLEKNAINHIRRLYK